MCILADNTLILQPTKTYNLMYKPWIPVQYIDGTCVKVGIAQCFKDAEKIRNIQDPIFYNRAVPLYTYKIVQLLTTIVESAYFKKETDFAAEDNGYLKKLAQTGVHTDVIRNYLERWAPRFDLFDDDYPFLQDKTLRQKIEKLPQPKQMSKRFDFVPSVNPLAPAANQLMSGYLCEEVKTLPDGSQSLLAHYQPTAEMFAFAVLFSASLCPNSVQYYSAMTGNACEWIVRNGANLNETIILNCVALTNSSSPTPDNPDVKVDAPAWEWDTPADYHEYIQQETFGSNLLASTYAPIQRVYGLPDENGNIIKAALWTKSELKKAEGNNEAVIKQHQTTFIGLHPSAIKKFVNVAKKNEPEQYEPSFVTYYSKYDAWAHSVSVTSSTGKNQHCAILSQPTWFPYTLTMYYRLMHEKKTSMFGNGKIELPDVTLALLNSECNEAARKVQNTVERAVYDLEVAMSIMKDRAMPDKWSKSQLFKTSYYSQVSKSVNDYFYRVFCEEVQQDANAAVQKAVEYIKHVTLQYFDRKYQNTNMISLYTKVRNRLAGRFKFYLTEETQ